LTFMSFLEPNHSCFLDRTVLAYLKMFVFPMKLSKNKSLPKQ
jgi:hypothetical protein